jgi:hypothetical protein
MTLTKQETTANMKQMFKEFNADKDREKKIQVLEKLFKYLMKKECAIHLFSDKKFALTVRKKCFEFLNDDIRTFSFISPIVHKYFFHDEKIVKRLKKARNYFRRCKQTERSLNKVSEEFKRPMWLDIFAVVGVMMCVAWSYVIITL